MIQLGNYKCVELDGGLLVTASGDVRLQLGREHTAQLTEFLNGIEVAAPAPDPEVEVDEPEDEEEAPADNGAPVPDADE
tara:strand:+ start:274 stop:510 length:237 start_codon:yes stop_codon:yes gene_type:complete